MLLCIPIVDREVYGHKWNRYLRCINVVLGIFTALALASTESEFYHRAEVAEALK